MNMMADQAGSGPGALLTAARERRGLHLATLAAQLKVPAARLSALEGERWDELPDPSYTRALATAVCRALEADAAPILTRMPGAAPAPLERVSEGLNQPLQLPGSGLQRLSRPVVGLVLLILLVGAGLSLWPRDLDLRTLIERWRPAPQAVAQETASTEPTALAELVQPLAASATSPAPAPVASAAAPLPASVASAVIADVPKPVPASEAVAAIAAIASDGPVLRVQAREDTWIRVADAGNPSLASRLLRAGETLELAVPRPPAQIHLGNAQGAALSWRGQAQDLSGQGRVLRLTLP